jgi:hypothetical protein
MLIACFKHHYHDQKALLVDFEAHGVKLAAMGASLRIAAPTGVLTPEPPTPP